MKSTLKRASVLGCAPLLLASAATAATDRVIDDVRLARQGGVATIDVVLACPADYLQHWPLEGSELRVRIELGAECVATFGTGIRGELHEPPRSTVAAIRQVRYDTANGRQATIVVTVSPSQQFSVSQGRARNIIRIELGGALPVTDAPVPVPAPLTEPTPTRDRPADAPPSRPATAPQSSDRGPIRLVQRPVEPRERFALQLAAGPGAGAPAHAVEHTASHTVYFNEHGAGDARWQELRLGFFDSEQEARALAAGLPPPYDGSIVVVADVAEQERALTAAAPSTGPRVPSVAEAADAPSGAAAPLPAERMATMTASADDAMRGGDHDTAIRLYARLLEDPSFAQRPLARERLGLARERKGQLAQARAEYAVYLAEFPAGADAERVQQRLAGLAAVATPISAPRDERSAEPQWDVTGGIAQYVRHFTIERLDDAAPLAEHSTLLSNVNLVVRRDGERFDLTQRIDAAYHYNLLGPAQSVDPADQLLVSRAYVDVTDGKRDWGARVGRQSRYGSGIVGRFDGAHVRYQWRPAVALNLVLGHPVDHPRHALEARRQFVGFSADVDRLVRDWDFSFFGILQTVDGIADREAVGAEARYRSDRWHVVGSLDTDLSYAVVNSALVNATWRATDKLTLTGRFNSGVAPFVTTRNAVIGQSAVTVERLLETYTEPQLRRIARDRTGQASQGTMGLSRPLLDRFQLHADLGFFDFEGSVASAGIPALPNARQTFVHLTFVGSSLFKDGDSAIFTLRHSRTRDTTNDALTFDLRLPTNGRVRLSPRVVVSQRQRAAGSPDELVVAPMLKLAVRWPKRHQFELEFGARQATRELEALATMLPPLEEVLTERFINAGYWWQLGR